MFHDKCLLNARKKRRFDDILTNMKVLKDSFIHDFSQAEVYADE